MELLNLSKYRPELADQAAGDFVDGMMTQADNRAIVLGDASIEVLKEELPGFDAGKLEENVRARSRVMEKRVQLYNQGRSAHMAKFS